MQMLSIIFSNPRQPVFILSSFCIKEKLILRKGFVFKTSRRASKIIFTFSLIVIDIFSLCSVNNSLSIFISAEKKLSFQFFFPSNQ